MTPAYRIITPAVLAREAPERWFRAYCRDGIWCELQNPERDEDKQEIYQNLRALRDSGCLSPATVCKAIGNASWTNVTCDVCYDESVPKALMVREDFSKPGDDIEFCVCMKCAQTITKMLKKRP